jgi:hypothetical protein
VNLTGQDRDRLEAMSEALARMVIRQRQMDERIARIEHALAAAGWLRAAQVEPAGAAPAQEAGVPPAQAAGAAHSPATAFPAQPGPALPPPSEAQYAPASGAVPPLPTIEAAFPPPLPPGPSAAEPAHAAPAPRPGVESTVGLNWISRIGALTLVIGVAFFFKYAFENRWIGETGRVLLGLAVAAALLAAGERFWRAGQRIYGQSLSAAGVGFAYLSLWAAHALYRLIAQAPAFAAMALVTAGACALALRYGGPAMAAIGLLGGYLTPLLLETGRAPWFVLGYALLLTLGARWLANRWPYLQILGLAGAAALYASQWANPIPTDQRFLYTFFALAFYGVFVTGPLTGVALIAQLLAPLLVAGISEPDLVALLPAVAVAAAGLVAADRRGSSWFVTASFAGWWLAYAAWWDGARRLHAESGPLAFQTVAFAAFLAWPLVRRLARDLPLRRTELLLMAANAILYFGTAYALLERNYGALEGFFAVAVATAQMGVAAALWARDRRAALLSAGAAWALLVLAAPIQFSGYRVTMAWALEGAALAWIGDRARDSRISTVSLFVYLLVLARLVGEDSWMFARVDYALLFNARFFTFAVAAASFFAAAFWMRERWRAASAYIGGHFVLVWALCLEASAWVARNASLPNLQSAQNTAISILLALYAVAMVAGGVVARSAITRIIGIGLIGFVVVKLYLYDVWALRPFYRVIAFAALGVAMLATASLYSRYRDKIGSWLRPE